jgi:hypothetical protein
LLPKPSADSGGIVIVVPTFAHPGGGRMNLRSGRHVRTDLDNTRIGPGTDSHMPREPVVVASRRVTLRDFMVFQLKLALDGLKDVVVFQVSIVAMVVDFLSGRGERRRWFYTVMGASQRFDRWLDLHGALQRTDA